MDIWKLQRLRNTDAFIKNGILRIYYYGEEIAEISGDNVILTLVQKTHMTKIRLNQISKVLELGYRVYQKGKHWNILLSDGSSYSMGSKVKFERD
ncbi:MAG: hypothetical protein NUV65_06905 [Candidatus Roizmanbacteria bacterium]|nr:hypothetical protein [Candidatus Roizmanbacteria bacterium]